MRFSGGGLRGKVSEENQSGVKDALTEVVEVGAVRSVRSPTLRRTARCQDRGVR